MENRQIGRPIIPTTITVHLGLPDEKSEDIHIPFIDYIKNVSCSEIFPSWPDAALRSNILAIISFTLNRIYNEYYPSQGYFFDITSLPNYDQTYKKGRDLFDNIGKIVDEIFNNYIVKGDHIEPYFASYCDGKNTLCKGLSQWGTVDLASKGKTPTEILKYYYGNDISIIQNAEVSDPITSYPGVPLKLGEVSEHVRIIKRQLNRIHVNYPAIPELNPIHEFYDVLLEQAVKKFQEIFDLEVTGIIDKATWYKIKYLYNAVKKLSDIYTEGVFQEEIEMKFGLELKKNDQGPHVQGLHYFLSVVAYFDEDIPFLTVDSIYDNNTYQMVVAFQKKYQLPVTGIVDVATWNKLKEVYFELLSHLPKEALSHKEEIYPGISLSLGMKGEEVMTLQQFLKNIYQKDPSFPLVDVIGCFDTKTETAVKKIQKEYQLEETGRVGPLEWKYIVEKAKK